MVKIMRSNILFIILLPFVCNAAGKDYQCFFKFLKFNDDGIICENSIEPPEIMYGLYDPGTTADAKRVFVNYHEPFFGIPWEHDEYVYIVDKDMSTINEYKTQDEIYFHKCKIPKHPAIDSTLDCKYVDWGGFKSGYINNLHGIKWNRDSGDPFAADVFSADILTICKNYQKYLLDILEVQGNDPLKLVKGFPAKNQNKYYHAYHARPPWNGWDLIEFVSTDRYRVPMIDGLANSAAGKWIEDENKMTNVAGDAILAKFELDKTKPDLVKFTNANNEKYNIYWYFQIYGQCVLHSLRTIIQGDTQFKTCKDFYDWTAEQKSNGKIFKVEHESPEELEKGQCAGGFSPCAVKLYLIENGYTLLQIGEDRVKKLANPEDLQKQTDFTIEQNSNDYNLNPVAIWFLYDGHSAVINIIKQDGGAGRLPLILDSGHSPFKWDGQLPFLEHLESVTLIYKENARIQNIKKLPYWGFWSKEQGLVPVNVIMPPAHVVYYDDYDDEEYEEDEYAEIDYFNQQRINYQNLSLFTIAFEGIYLILFGGICLFGCMVCGYFLAHIYYQCDQVQKQHTIYNIV